MSENEDRYHDTVLDLEAKLKKNVDLILKLGNSLQGMFMLGPKSLSMYDQQLKHGNSEISLNIRDTEDTLDDASKSQQKVYEKMNDPINSNATPSIPASMPSESPLIIELDKIKNGFQKLSELIQKNCKRARIFYTSPEEIQLNDFCQDQLKPIVNELQFYFELFKTLFQRDIKEMKDVFESTESELYELEKQNDFLKDQLLEVSLKHEVELGVLLNHECVDNSLHAEIEQLKKKSIEIQEGLQTRIKILEKDVQRIKNTNPLDYSWISKMEKLENKNVSLDFTMQSLIKKRDNVKLEHQKLFNSIKKTRSQTQTEMDELIAHVSEKTYSYGAIRAENQNLLFTISELKIDWQMLKKMIFLDINGFVILFHSKDETPEIIKKFIAQAQLNYKAKVCKIRTDNDYGNPLHVKFDELTTMASKHDSLEPVLQRFINHNSSAETIKTPSKEDLDNLFGPMFEEYFEKKFSDTPINSAAQPTQIHEDSPSTSSIIIDEHEVPPIVTTSDEQTCLIFLTEADEFNQEDSADFDGNSQFVPYNPLSHEEIESSTMALEPSNVIEFHHNFKFGNLFHDQKERILLLLNGSGRISVMLKILWFETKLFLEAKGIQDRKKAIDFEESFVCWRLEVEQRALYGLKQAPRAWDDKLSSFLIEHGFTKGGLQFLGGKLLSWSSKKQDCTAMAITEDELNYVPFCMLCIVICMRTQLLDNGYKYNRILMYCDSKSAIAISCNPV
ncbi:hypothetical protein Tco_0534565 [Tanacetum coccineum]